MEYQIKELNVSDIKPDKNQPRKSFDDESLQHLSESILSNGLLNPIEVDEDYIITDGERRWKAHKLAGIKKITVRIVKNKNNIEKLRRQLIFSLQDEEIPTEEKYQAIVKLWEATQNTPRGVFCKDMGLATRTLDRAINYINDKRENPKAVEGVSAGVWREIRTLPEKEREEIKKELKKKDSDNIIELAKQKREIVEQRREIEKLRQEKSAKEVKIITDRERLFQIRDEIIQAQNDLNKLMTNVQWIRKKKFYFMKAKEKDNFLKFIEGAADRARNWAEKLDDLRDNIALEILEE